MSGLHWALQREQPRAKSEDEDSDFFIISDESDDEEDNRLRQEYDTNRPRYGQDKNSHGLNC